jgi:hypothetical protein
MHTDGAERPKRTKSANDDLDSRGVDRSFEGDERWAK